MKNTQFTAARADTGAPLPQARATVYFAGTTTQVQLFSTPGVPRSNPVVADSNGLLQFYAPDGVYDVQVSSADGSLSLPLIEDLQIYDLSGVVGTITSGRLSYATWAELSGVTATSSPLKATPGMIADVPISDSGTHTDPGGGTVSNSGVFRYQAAPAGWKRIYDSIQQGLSDATQRLNLTSAQFSSVVGAPTPVTRGNGVVTGMASSGVYWSLPVAEDGYLQAVTVFAAQGGNFTVVTVNASGVVTSSQSVNSGGNNTRRMALLSIVAVQKGGRVGLLEDTGLIAYNPGGTDVVFIKGSGSPDPHTVGTTPGTTSLTVTASWSYEVGLVARPLAQAAALGETDIDSLRRLLQPTSLRTDTSGNLVATYIDGQTQNFGPIASGSKVPVANNVYATDDPPMISGSPAVMSRVAGNGGVVVPTLNKGTVPAYRRAHAANPSLVVLGARVYLYFRADPGSDVQSLGCWSQAVAGFDPLDATRWTDHGAVIGPAAGYDGVWDPCAVILNGKVRVYWSSHTSGNPQFYADSADGTTFSAAVSTNIQGLPGLIVVDGTVYQFGGPGDGIWMQKSTDGTTFSAPSAYVVSADTDTSMPDSGVLDTVRLFYQAPYMYMVYGGFSKDLGYSNIDWPENMCVARGVAPFGPGNWEKYPANPILLRGPAGAPDAGALWSGSYLRLGGVSYFFYEAMGGTDNGTRNNPYQGFGYTAFSQVMVALAPPDVSLVNWSADVNDLPQGVYTIRNVETGKYLGTSDATSAAIVAQYGIEQNWIVRRVAGGYHQLSLQAAGGDGAQVLDNPAASLVAGTRMGVFPSPSPGGLPYHSQEYKLVPQVRPGGVYEIINRHSGMNVEVENPVRAEGTRAVQNPRSGKARQKWQFTKVG